MAHVAHYQNEGTDKVSPARFVERAAAENDNWSEEVEETMDEYTDGNEGALRALATEVASDIGDACDRVKTGKLKASFRGQID